MTTAEFVAHVFDQPPESDKTRQWYRSARALIAATDSSVLCECLTQTYERSGDLLAPYTDEQINQGLYYINEWSGINWRALMDEATPQEARLRALRSYVPLFEQVMATRCPSIMASGRRDPAKTVLNSTCYMWWENTFRGGTPEDPKRRHFDAAALEVMEAILAIPHLGCQESALHGLNHWYFDYPSETEAAIDRFLAASPNAAPKLLSYAKGARSGGLN